MRVLVRMALPPLLMLAMGFGLGRLTAGTTRGSWRPSASRPPDPSEVGKEVDSEVAKDLRVVLGKLRPPLAEVGVGGIRGRVTDAHGNAVPAVKVFAYLAIPQIADDVDPAFADQDIVHSVRAFVRRWYAIHEPEAEAQTDDAGRFELKGLRGTKYVVRAWSERYKIEAEDDPGVEVVTSIGSEVELLATRLVGLCVQIVLPSGEQPRDATVVISGCGSTFFRQWSGERSTFQLVPGEYTIKARVTQDDERTYESSEVSVLIREFDERKSVTLGAVAANIVGSIDFGGSTTAAYFDVLAKALFDGQSAADSPVSGPEWRTEVLGGSYEFRGLPPGRYEVSVVRGTACTIVRRIVTVGVQTARCDFTVEDLTPLRPVRLRAYDSGGRCLRDVHAAGAILAGSSDDATDVTEIAQPDGSYLLLNLSPIDENAAVILDLESERCGHLQVSYRIGQCDPVDARFLEPATASVATVGPSPAGRLWVGLRRAASVSRGLDDCSTERSPEGLFHFVAVAPGRYDVFAFLEVSVGSSIMAAGASVDVLPGHNNLSVRLPLFHRLLITDLRPGEHVVLVSRRDDSEESINLVAGLKGDLEVPALPEGSYRVVTDEGQTAVELFSSACVTRQRVKPAQSDSR